MATSKRELIIQAIVAAVRDAEGIEGRVYRSDPEGVGRGNTPCINVTWSSENASPMTVPMLERTLTVSVSVVTRGDEPDSLADPIIVDAHRLVMADTTLGGLAMDIAPDSTSFEFVSADGTAGKLTQNYLVMFRTGYEDMTQ